MSLAATWCKCSDGKWYKEPLWVNRPKKYDWFICLDDDEPPELVVRGGKVPPTDLYTWFQPTTKFKRVGYRNFSVLENIGEVGNYAKGIRRFGKLVRLPPPPTIYQEVCDERPPHCLSWYNVEVESTLDNLLELFDG